MCFTKYQAAIPHEPIKSAHIGTARASPLVLCQQSWRADEQQWIKIAEVHFGEVMEIDEGYLV